MYLDCDTVKQSLSTRQAAAERLYRAL